MPWKPNIPGRLRPGGAVAHGSPWYPAESVQREGVPCATPAKLLYCAMHPAWRETGGETTQHTRSIHRVHVRNPHTKLWHLWVAQKCKYFDLPH